MGSNDLRAVAGQGELPLARPPMTQPVADEVIFGCKSFGAAIQLAVSVSGLEEKEIYLPLGIDAGHWTRVRKGEAHFPVDKLNALCDLLGNEVPLIWWAHSRGKGLHLLKSEAERLLDESRAREQRVEAENALLKGLLTGRAQ